MWMSRLLFALLIPFFCGAEASGSPLCRTRSTPLNEGVRGIDFCNFTFPYFDEVNTFNLNLKNGTRRIRRDKYDQIVDRQDNVEAHLEDVAYGQIEGLGEVVVCVINVWGGGSMINHAVYMFVMDAGTLKLVWRFVGGDRSDGGLRRLYFNSGNLVLETYEEGPDEPLCCASHFERHYYRWKQSRIREFKKKTDLPLSGPISEAIYLGHK
jgi:hypothetical protein